MDRISEQARKYYYGFDIIKLLAAVCVVAIHTQPLIELEGTALFCMYDFVVRLAVPFFFMVSGFLLFSKFNGCFDSTENRCVLKKYILRTIRLYLVWHLIYLPISLYGILLSQSISVKAIARYIINMLCVGQQWYSWPLWYLLSSIYALSFFLLMITLGFKKKKIFIASIIIYLVSFIVTYIGSNSDTVGIVSFVSKLINETFVSGRVFSGIGYMAVGMVVANNEKYLSRKKSLIVLAISAAASLILFKVGVPLTETPLLIIPAYALFCIGRSYSGNAKKQICEFCRKANTSIYFTHMIFFFIGGLLFWGFVGNERFGWMPFIWTLGLSTVVSFVVCCWRNTKLIKLLFT